MGLTVVTMTWFAFTYRARGTCQVFNIRDSLLKDVYSENALRSIRQAFFFARVVR